MTVQYAAFGETAVSVAGVRHPITRRRERGVLSVLLAAHGAPVAPERLVSEVWGDDAATQTLAPLQVAVSRLRTLLEPDRTARSGTRLVSTAAGYALRADDADVDTWSFEQQAEAALAEADPGDRLARCEGALELWSAPPYADVDAPSVRAEADRLAELQLSVQEQRARALLDLGRPDDAQRMLAEVATRHPFREGLWSLLAMAQYAASRQADALATLRTLREALADELGVDPLPETRQLEEAILRQDLTLGSATPDAAAVAGRVAATQAVTTVGRDDLVDQVWSAHQAGVEASRPTFVLVSGEAGIGKSQLVADLVGSAGAQRTRVVVGNCLEGEYAPALWPWLHVVRALAADGVPDPELEPLLGDEARLGEAGPGTRLRMFDAVVSLLARTSESSPLLVVLEDLHWADESSLLLLRHLVTSHASGALTVVCTRRTSEHRLAEALVDTMAALARAGAEQLRLGGLGVDSVRALLDRSVGSHDSGLDEFVTEVTAGNPFFVLQYARLLAATPDVSDPSKLPVPDGVRDVLRQRIARLPEEASHLLACGSVLGRRIDPDLLAELTGTPIDGVLDALDLAMASGLLEGDQADYTFVHALARETLYSGLSAARRMRLHDRAGHAVEDRHGDDPDAAAEIAHHAHVAAPLGSEHAERACTWLARAAEVAVSRNAHPEALELWHRVLSDTAPRSLGAAGAYSGMAAALMRSGRMTEAHTALDAAVSIASEHGAWDVVADAASVLIGAGAWSWRGLGDVHAPLVQTLTTAVPHVSLESQARLLAVLQMESFHALRSDLVADYGQQSVDLARQVGDPALLREVLSLRLVVQSGSWDTDGRLALAEELLDLAPEGELRATVLFHLGHVLWERQEPDAADATMVQCADAVASVRHTGLEIPLGWWHASRARDRDDPAHLSLIDRAIAAHREAGYFAGEELDCLHAVRRGPVGAPVDDAIVAMAERSGMPVRAVVGHALLEAGRPEDAKALVGAGVADDLVNYCSTAARCLRLLVLAETGTSDEIRQALAPLEPYLGRSVNYGTIDHLGVVDHFVAAAYAALGDDRAVELARSAVDRNRRLGVLPWLRRSESLLT